MEIEKTYHVFELNQTIKRILETSFSSSIWVQGEIADFDRHAQQRNIFFQLQEKDKALNRLLATVDCLLRNETKPYLRQKLAEGGVVEKVSSGMDGLEVRLKVRVSVYPPNGKYSLLIEDIDPEFTLGKLEQNRKHIIEFLEKHHLLEKNKRMALPIVVSKIGLITKEGSQAYFDFFKKLEESQLSFSISLYQSATQGRSVEKNILKALEYFKIHQEVIDALVIIRGGGSKSDLSWFDNQNIAEAIANFPKPVLTGIGHKTDTSIADLVAYQALPTPNAVAGFLVEHNEVYLQKLEKLVREINLSLKDLLRFHRQAIDNLQKSISSFIGQRYQFAQEKLRTLWEEIIRNSRQYLGRQNQKIFDDYQLAVLSAYRRISSAKEKLQRIQEGIKSLDPENILKRGFSLTTVNGKIISSPNHLQVGQTMWTYLYQGKIKSIIKNVQKNKN